MAFSLENRDETWLKEQKDRILQLPIIKLDLWKNYRKVEKEFYFRQRSKNTESI